MEHQQRIEAAYSAAVSGIQEDWFTEQPAFAWHNYVANLPKHLQVTYLIVVLHKQVVNGTFDQYFSNGYGLLFAELAANAFMEVGAKKGALLITNAIALLKKQAFKMKYNWGFASLESHDLISILNSPKVNIELEDISDDYLDEYYSTEMSNKLLELLGSYLQKKFSSSLLTTTFLHSTHQFLQNAGPDELT